MELITHFSHRHELALRSQCKMENERCKICDGDVRNYGVDNEEVYTCSKGYCTYSIHRLCAEFPEKTVHPFHPHHTLVFCTSEDATREDGEDGEYVSQECSLCRETCVYGFLYCCQDCQFFLDPVCAALAPIQAKPPMNRSIIHHQHPVLECVKPNVHYFRYSCQGCGETIEQYENVFVCIECKTLLHEICASLPDEIVHPFHLQHSLTLQIPEGLHGPNICLACRGPDQIFSMYTRYRHKVYHCSSCKFSLDVHCASLKPITDLQLKKIITPSHPHPLIQCGMIKNFRRPCYGCGIGIEGFIYACLDCNILLNKSCVDLPLDIAHPFHQQHRLRIGSSPLECRGCHRKTGQFSYSCGKCKFDLDPKCATKSFEFVNMEVHNHALAYFDFRAGGGMCQICRGECTEYFFRCIDCHFSIHDHCCPSLPYVIKHPFHFHSLTFTCSVIKDVPDEDEFGGEFYCHACEELRDIYSPTYYCYKCHFVAHVHCVISEIIAYLKAERIPLVDKAREKEEEGFGYLECQQTKEEEDDDKLPKTSDRDEEHKSKGEEQTKEEEHDGTHAYDAGDREKRTHEFDLMEDENNKAANKERMLQDIDEQINSLKEELANLVERRARLLGAK